MFNACICYLTWTAKSIHKTTVRLQNLHWMNQLLDPKLQTHLKVAGKMKSNRRCNRFRWKRKISLLKQLSNFNAYKKVLRQPHFQAFLLNISLLNNFVTVHFLWERWTIYWGVKSAFQSFAKNYQMFVF